MKQIVVLPICFCIFFLLAFPVFAAPVINEFLPNPVSGDSEWIELYNPDDVSIDLSDYYFDDDTDFNSDAGTSNKVALAGILSAKVSCYKDLSTVLNNNGDNPTLFKIDGSTVDTYTYATSTTDKSYSRIPDGGSWQTNQTPSKSSTQCTDLIPTPTPTLSPTPTPTKTPTPSPTQASGPTNTPTHTPTPTKTPTPTPLKSSPTPTGIRSTPLGNADETITFGSTSGDVLSGATGSGNTINEAEKPKKSLKPFIFSFLFIGLGSALLVFVYYFKKGFPFKNPHDPL